MFRKTQKVEIENVESKFIDELNAAAESDNKLFWGLIRKRRVGKRTSCTQIETIDGNSRDPIVIGNTFTNYYKSIYNPSASNTYNDDFKLIIEREVDHDREVNAKSADNPAVEPNLTNSDIDNYIKDLKAHKAASHDGIFNEHLKYGSTKLKKYIAQLFNLIIEKGRIPKQFRKGVIIPIYKDNGKSRLIPCNYRPITLLPCVYKLLEKVIHNRLSSWVSQNDIAFPNRQQNAYQKHTSAITASFNLQETIFHNTEQKSKVYVAMLDTRQAFDTVWLPGVFHKLFKLWV